MQLPERLLPPGLTPWTHVLTHGVVPVLLALGLGLVLYRHLVQPLNELRERANTLSAGDLAPLASSRVTRRRMSWASWPAPTSTWPSACARA
jgi:two-component system sensor histidine kinase PfeS